MKTWFDDDDLGEMLDDVRPLELRGAEHNDGLIAHPDWWGVYAKFGMSAPKPDRPQRLLVTWLRIAEPPGRQVGEPQAVLHILTVRAATPAEIAFFEEWDDGR